MEVFEDHNVGRRSVEQYSLVRKAHVSTPYTDSVGKFHHWNERNVYCRCALHHNIAKKNNFIFNQYFRKNGKIDLEHISQKEMYIRIVEKKVFNFSIVDKNILLIDKKKYFHKNNGTMTKKNTCVICDLKWRIVCTVITHMYVQSWIGLKWKMFYQFETS